MYNFGVTAYLGDETSYSHAAATLMVGGRLCGYDSMSKVIDAVRSGKSDAAVLPVENNVEGVVNEVYDMLFDSGLYIVRQLILPIRHSLIAAEGMSLADIKTVRSHPQAIAQCRRFLSTLPVTVEAVPSTSEALHRAGGDAAAIAYMPLPGQTAIATGIQDSALNATRFSLFTHGQSDGGNTVSVAFDLVDRPGSLLAALSVIEKAHVNMTRIISRPNRTGDGRYRFFVDFDFAADSAALGALLDAIAGECEAFRLLGRYNVVTADGHES